MKKIDISVVVAIYNVQDYLEQCIDSIVHQTKKEIEIILVNDGSTDKCLEICKRYAIEDERIVVINQSNQGLVRARKAGINIARGRYVILVDGDDYIETNACEKMYGDIVDEPKDFIHYNFFYNDNKISENVTIDEEIELIEADGEKFFADTVLTPGGRICITPSIWSKIFEREFLCANYAMVPDSQSFGEDLLFLAIAMKRGCNFSLKKDALYHYRVREESMSHSADLNAVYCVLGLMRELKNVLSDNLTSEIEKYASCHVIEILKLIEHPAITIQKYVFSKYKDLFDKRIVIYGAGEVGTSIYTQLSKYSRINIVAWVDSNFSKLTNEWCEIEPPSRLNKRDYDSVLVCVYDQKVYEEIRNNISQMGISKEIIIWGQPKYNIR